EMRPIIGLSMDCGEREKDVPIAWLKEQYVGAVLQAGGLPWPLPAVGQGAAAIDYIEKLHGLVITGGDLDIHPRHYGEENRGKVRQIIEQRTDFELALLDAAWRRGLPILGVCGGEQLLNVYFGGALEQHIDGHERCSHGIDVVAGSLLQKLLAGKQNLT